jgi:glycosyltransferase involved in cell wall biosynthesis
MVLLEGASCGRPIVTTDVPGCRQIVKNNEGGLSVPIKNPEALAKAIKTLVESKDLREKMGKRGRQIILEEFSVEIVIDQTIALYEKLMKTRGISPEASAPS